MSLAEDIVSKKIAEIMRTQQNNVACAPVAETLGLTVGWGIQSLRKEPVESNWAYPAGQAEQPCP